MVIPCFLKTLLTIIMITDQEYKDHGGDQPLYFRQTPMPIIMIADQEFKDQVCDHLQYLLQTPLHIIMIADQKSSRIRLVIIHYS
jgi:hypothetical protein